MKACKKILTLFTILLLTTTIISCFRYKYTSVILNTTMGRPIKVGVLLNNNYTLSYLIMKSLEDIQKENAGKVEFTFFDGKGNPAVENEILNNIFNNRYDFILENIADTNMQELVNDSVYKAQEKNIPLIFFNISPNPNQLNVIKGYPKSVVVDIDSAQAGILQGKLIADYWNTNKKTMDKNKDKVMQYIMLEGRHDRYAAEARTKNSISTINDSGIKTQELALATANWDEELAKIATDSFFLKYNGKIEAIIANNDSMAIGAVKALQKYGYNIGNKEKLIPVFGIDEIPEAKDLINKGFMAGSVPIDPRSMADALYVTGMNLISGRNPIEGTNYIFEKPRVLIPM